MDLKSDPIILTHNESTSDQIDNQEIFDESCKEINQT